MALRAVVYIIPLALFGTLIVGSAINAGPLTLLLAYSAIGQAALLGVLIAGWRSAPVRLL